MSIYSYLLRRESLAGRITIYSNRKSIELGEYKLDII